MEISSVWYKEPHLFETFLLDKDLSLFSKTKSLVLLRATTLKCVAMVFTKGQIFRCKTWHVKAGRKRDGLDLRVTI